MLPHQARYSRLSNHGITVLLFMSSWRLPALATQYYSPKTRYWHCSHKSP